MALEIGMASFNPNFATVIWVDGPPTGTCGNISGNQAYKGIQEATANSITVEMDIRATAAGSSPDGNVNDPNEIIRYLYQPTSNPNPNDDGWISRSTSCVSGTHAFLGNQVGNIKEIRVVNATAGAGGASIPMFTYYDGNDVQIPYANLPASIPDIRRIRITLVVDTEAIDRSLNRRRRTISSTSIIPRNHAIN